MKNLCCETNKTIYLGLSGGVDSVVLLHMLINKHKVKAIHVNHGLQKNAEATENLCLNICKMLNISLKVIRLQNLSMITKNKEKQYRDARFDAIIRNIPENSVLALAHHFDDQLETKIKRLFTGSSALHGIQEQTSRQNITIIRPLLTFKKSEIIDYANFHKLKWIEDPSNQELAFERNKIRHLVIPTIKQVWPGFATALTTLSEKQQLASEVCDEIAQIDYAKIVINNQVNINKLAEISTARQLNFWFKYLEKNQLFFDHRRAKDLLKQILNNKNTILLGSNKIWVKHKDQGQVITEPKQSNSILWNNLEQTLALDIGILSCSKAGNLRPPNNDETVVIKYRCYGTNIMLANKKHSQKLKKLFQEWQIPAWKRSLWPLIFYNNKLACIPNHGICEGFFCKDGINICLQDKAQEPLGS